MKLQAKKKTIWSTFKNAYLRSKDLKSYWNKLEKKNLYKELIETINLYLNSESYNLSSKFWRHLIMNHLNLMTKNDIKSYNSLFGTKIDGISRTLSRVYIKKLFRKYDKMNLDDLHEFSDNNSRRWGGGLESI